MAPSVRILTLIAAAFFAASVSVRAATDSDERPTEENQDGAGQNPSKLISEHLSDSYWWHILTWKENHLNIYLPVIVRTKDVVVNEADNSKEKTIAWHIFSSRRLDHGQSFQGLKIADEGKYAGKIVAFDTSGNEYRPLDLSVTKTALALMINSLIMILLFLGVARWYKRKPKYAVPGGFAGAVEMFIMNIEDEVIKPNVGKDYERYSPYLLTAFFFILINNVMGLIPIFPGGANTTGNIAVTLVLALCTMVAVNVFGNREYWKEILWPDVPIWLKPIMIPIELFGIITKPFALMIRLLANIFAGHTIILALTFLIFGAVKMGTGVAAGMTIFSTVMSVFMLCLELLVAYIQAYVFTVLSSVFIGMSRAGHHPAKKPKKKTQIAQP